MWSGVDIKKNCARVSDRHWSSLLHAMSGGAERKQPWQKSYLFATLFSAMASSLAWAVQVGGHGPPVPDS